MLKIFKNFITPNVEKKEVKVEVNPKIEVEQLLKREESELNKVVKVNKKNLIDLHAMQLIDKDLNEKKNHYIKSIYSSLDKVGKESKHIFYFRQFHMVDFPSVVSTIDDIRKVKNLKNVNDKVRKVMTIEVSEKLVETLKVSDKNLQKIKA